MSRATLPQMGFTRTRLAVVLLGDRLCVAAVQGQHVHAFVVESEQPATALRAELDARHLAPRAVAVGLPRAAVTVKPVELPAVGADTREMVRFELERHVPFATEDAAFAFVPLSAAEAGEATDGTRRVLLAAAERRVVDTALRIVQEAKLRPRSVTVGAHDLIALVRPQAAGRVVWIHRVEETLDILFVVGRRVVMSRTLPVVDETTLASEIRRSLSLVRWPAFDAIWMSGDAVPPEAPMDSPLADLGAPITAPPYTVAARRALGAIDGGARGALELAVAVATAPADSPLDLLPESLRPFRLTRAQILTAGVAAAAIALAIVALMVPGYRDAKRLAALNGDIARLDREVRAVEGLLKDLEGKRRLVSTIDGLEASALKPLPVLRELTELLPNDAWLTLLSLDAKGAELTGQANAASALIPLLENSPRFERVEFASPVTRGRDREQFRIQAAWEARPTTAAVPATPPARTAQTPAAPVPVPSAPAARPMPPTPGAPPPVPLTGPAPPLSPALAPPVERSPVGDGLSAPAPRRPTPPDGRR
jgi:Tfp pilus assembly protein PilN